MMKMKSAATEGAPTFPLWHRLFRAMWNVTWAILCSWTPPMMWRWRSMVLRLFGANIGVPCDVRSNAKVWYPPNLTLADHSMLAERVNCYNVAPIRLGTWSIVSQGAYLCTASHDVHTLGFPLVASPIEIQSHCWVASDAFVGPGVIVKTGSVLAARAVVSRDTEAWKIYAGNPARAVKDRSPESSIFPETFPARWGANNQQKPGLTHSTDFRGATMATSSERFGTHLTRLGEYIRRFGLSGIPLALEHQVKYRLARGDSPRATSIPGVGEIYLRPRSSDLSTFREIFVNRDYDLDAHGILDIVRRRHDEIHAAGRTPLILDAGANVGLATRQFKHFFAEADVIAVEPGAESLSVARLNVAGLTAVVLRRAAIWKEDTTVTLNDALDQSARSVGGGACAGGESVAAVTMDTLLGGRKDDLFLVKVDIEGAEKWIFGDDDTPTDWLRARPVVIIEGHDGTHNEYGSLAGLLRHESYREGRINATGPALIVIPRELFSGQQDH